MSDTEPRRQDIRQPEADIDIAVLSIQDAREYLPAEAERVDYHLREAAQLLRAHDETVYVVPTNHNSYTYHTDRDCERLPEEGVKEQSIAQLGDRTCCAVCAGEMERSTEPDWTAYRAALNGEVDQ